MNEKEFYQKNIVELYEEFNSSAKGLSETTVLENRHSYGENILKQTKGPNIFSILLSQFKSSFIYILLIATAIVLLLGEYVDGLIILAIIILNTIIGAIQEGKAQNTLESLKKYTEGHATVMRSGKYVVIKDSEVVPGDILILKDGEAVSADARIIESNNLRVNEASLTGESEKVLKDPKVITEKVDIAADQINMVFKGTSVMSGFGRAIVVQTGHNTEIGKIAEKLDSIDSDIPLKKNIQDLSRAIIICVVSFSIIIFLFGLLHDNDVKEMFITVVAVAISAIPESLPLVVTLVLATGFWRMSKKNALVKRLQAVEALGQAKVLALDKTGTITKNQMTVEALYVDGEEYQVSGSGYSPEGDIRRQGQMVVPATNRGVLIAAQISSFTAVAELALDKKTEQWKLLIGDPTEAALKVFGTKMGMEKDQLLLEYPQVFEIPFDLHTKHHSAINIVNGKPFLSVAGSYDVLINSSKTILKDGEPVKITEKDLKNIKKTIRSFSKDGYRILALACHFDPPKGEDIDPYELPALTFVGLVAIRDAIRPEVFQSIRLVKEAGLKPIMITGDNTETAKVIAENVGIFNEGDEIIEGKNIESLKVEELASRLDRVTVFSRVSPEHKMKIIQAFQDRKEIIAMTGDGTNDALSLVAADLGVAMGGIGTEVAKEAADIVLLDDNFGTIAAAVEEGRAMYSTIRKSILYLLSTNTGEILVIAIAVIFGLPLPLLATQIIWLNMATDSFLVAALAMEPKSPDLLVSKKRKPSLIDGLMAWRMFLIGSVMTLGTLVMFYMYLPEGIVKATTISLTVLTVFQWFNVFNVRSDSDSIFRKDIFSKNKYLVLSLFVAIILQAFALYTPFMQKVLHTTGLSIKEWGIILVLCTSVIFVEEVRKFFYRLRFNRT